MTDADRLRSYLTTLGAAALERHLDARPDVLVGAPLRDLDDLAERLMHPSGIAAALGGAPLPALQVLEVLTACGAGASEARAVELLAPEGAGPEHATHVARVAAELRERVLVVPVDDGGLVVNPGVRVFFDVPLGMGRTAATVLPELTADALKRAVRRWGGNLPTRKADLAEAAIAGLGDPEHVRRLVRAAPPDVARRLHELAEYAARLAGARGLPAAPRPTGDTVGMYLRSPAEYRAEQETTRWLLDHGLGFSRWSAYAADAAIPAEVLLALLPDGVALPFEPQPPPLPRAAVTAAQVSSSAGGALTGFLAAAMGTLETIGREPLAPVRTGGVGAREITALAKRLGVDAADVRLTLELAAPLDLLGQDRAGAIRTSPLFDQWRELPPADRAADLLLVWLGLDGTPTLDRDENGKSVPALTRTGDDPGARVLRHVVLGALASDDGTGVVAADALAELLAWQMPTVLGEDAHDAVGLVWAEAERLGVAAHGALSGIGRAALAGDAGALVAALTAALPSVQRTALFGSDLTVVVAGTPDAAVVDLLDATATRESRGSASTWRITPDSVRRALDDGYVAADLLDRLGDLSDGALPQALEYLVRDVGRRYGHVRVRPAGAVLIGDDEALLAEMEVHRSLKRLGLRRVAPTVLVAAVAPDDVVPALRKAGYLPLHLDADGDPVVRVGRGTAAPPARGGRRRAAEPDVPGRPGRRGSEQPGADQRDAGGDVRPLGGAPGVDDGPDDLPVADEVLDLWAEAHAMLRIDRGDGGDAEGGGDGDPAGAEAGPSLRVVESAAAVADRLVRRVPPPESRAASSVRDEIAASARRLSGTEVRQLAHAITDGVPVRIEYRSSSGGRSVRVVSDLQLEGGRLYGWCHLRDAERVFAVASILSVGPA